MKPTRRPIVSLVSETGMFVGMSSLFISGGPLSRLRCAARVRHCLRLLVRVVDSCVIQLVRLICSRIILTASSPGVLSKVFERLVSVRLGRFMERSCGLLTTQFPNQKGLDTCDALLCVSHTLQSTLESWLEARIVISVQPLIGSSIRAFYKLCSVGIGGSLLSILTQFLSNRSQHVMVDGCRSKLVNVVSESATGQCFGPVIVPPVHFGFFFYSEKSADRLF